MKGARQINQANVRLRTSALIHDFGTKQTFICQHTGICSSDMSRFLNNSMLLTSDQAERLNTFLVERGYSDELRAFGAIVQGSFID